MPVIGPIPWSHSIPSVTRCRCCHCRHGHRCAGGVQQWRRATVATPGEWQCKTAAVANGPNIFHMLLVFKSCIKSCNMLAERMCKMDTV